MEIQKEYDMIYHDSIAAIILNYISWNDTLFEAQLIHDLVGLDWNQIIIVDNASPNESEKVLSKKSIGDYVFIETGSNKGYASGNNVGLRYAYTHGFLYGWILNNDIILKDTNILDEMLRIIKMDNSVAVVNPDIYSPDGHLFNRDSIKASFYDLTLGFWAYRKKGRSLIDVNGYGYVYRPQGCCMMVDLFKLNEIGYFDENTFLYCEELILAEKLLKKGWKCACANRIDVIHNHSKTVKTVLGKYKQIKVQNRSYIYYLKKYRGYSFFQCICCLPFYMVKNLFTN